MIRKLIVPLLAPLFKGRDAVTSVVAQVFVLERQVQVSNSRTDCKKKKEKTLESTILIGVLRIYCEVKCFLCSVPRDAEL